MAGPAPDTIAKGRKLFAQEAEFVAGATSPAVFPRSRLPEIAFVGRSNCGKSSLINALTGRRALARTSKMPGRTQAINFFRIGNSLMLSDLPGYGYAQAPKALSAEWQQLIGAYLAERPNLKRVLLLADARRGIMAIDRAAMALVDKAAVSFCLVLTKMDKLKPQEREGVIGAAAAELQRHPAAYPELDAVSAKTGEGLDALKSRLAPLAAA